MVSASAARESSSQGNLLRESSIGLELSRLHRISLGVITADEFGISFGIWSTKGDVFSIHASVFLIRDTLLIWFNAFVCEMRNGSMLSIAEKKKFEIYDGLECSVIREFDNLIWRKKRRKNIRFPSWNSTLNFLILQDSF